MPFLFYKNECIGEIEEDEQDPPFYSGYFTANENLSGTGQRASDYLLFCTKEFEMKEDSPAHLLFETEKETLFPEFIFSDEWKVGEEFSAAVQVDDPMLTKEGMIFWSVPG